ncbi:(E2-independent) E3 ubiquitin-conjugating enzyme FATS isoform X2 [Sarcophilus harrisii]|uniref:Fragile-site associated tumor suppressor n=1 Tax=Sarcophilus harrisii TaxID=9305 RepID=G3WKR9_SARHA|nr:(E2-independent) E3 ubiquitin-conjugating enzyme FATS isoform X2 [Sarcophilus harrisii]
MPSSTAQIPGLRRDYGKAPGHSPATSAGQGAGRCRASETCLGPSSPEGTAGQGLQASPYDESNRLSLRGLQSEVAEKKPDYAKETRMISSLLISQLMDERRLQKAAPALPGQGLMLQPAVGAPGQPLAPGDQAFSLLPGRMGIRTSSGEAGLGARLFVQEGSRDLPPRRGFSSITITARQVVPGAAPLRWGSAVDPPCSKCGAKDRRVDKAAPAKGRDPPPKLPNAPEGSANSPAAPFRAPEPRGPSGQGSPCWVLNPENKENAMIPPALPSHGEKVPLVFSSCVHLRVSQPGANTVRYLDRSLSVPLGPPPVPGSRVHRSVLSLSLGCSSHRLTADGADRMANAGQEAEAAGPLSPRPAKPGQARAPAAWEPNCKGSRLRESPPGPRVPAGSHPCPWGGTPTPGNPALLPDSGKGTDPSAVGKGRGDGTALYHTVSHPNKLAIHIPGWSYTAGDYQCCDLVVKLKDCRSPSKERGMAPASPPAPPEPMHPEKPDPPPEQDTRLDPEITVLPAHSLTLREALEVHKPQFISRSQERLRKLESMAQQRKAQRGESPRKKPSPLPLRTAKKKQYTIPHPLSDNLFKPKERCISEKEMHMRSKRIYNNLPEVKKKKEEQKKRVILQSNRLRAEVFKKQLLDQILQRSTD